MEVKRFLNVQQLAEYIDMSISYVYKKVSLKQIPYYKLGSRTLFEISEIDKWVINGGIIKEDLPPLPKV